MNYEKVVVPSFKGTIKFNGNDVSGRLFEAMDIVLNEGKVSVAMLSRKMNLTMDKAGWIVDELESNGFTKCGKIAMTRSEFEEIIKEY